MAKDQSLRSYFTTKLQFFCPPSKQDILPASQNDYPEALHHNNGDGVSLSCHSGSDASESLVLNGTIVGTPEGSSTASPVNGLTPNDTTIISSEGNGAASPVNGLSSDDTTLVDSLNATPESVACTGAANGSGASCTNVQSSGGSSKSTSGSTEQISKYLIQYVPDTPVRKKGSLKRVTGQRVLTSTEGQALLKKTKRSRNYKKRKKDRQKKKLEKEKLLKEKAEEKRKRKAAAAAEKKRLTTSRRTQKGTSIVEPENVSESDELMEPSTSKEPDQNDEGDVENEDAICCECNVSYEDDVRNGFGDDWVRCACENCIDEVIIGANGKQHFCSYCVV